MATENSFSYNISRERSFESTSSFVKPETSIITACMWKTFHNALKIEENQETLTQIQQ
jgi:hypothetical protein